MLTEDAVLYYAKRPVYFVEDIIKARPEPYQADILQSVADNTMTSVRSGHGTGKSAVQAWAVLWFIATRPFPKVPCTAPTQHQLSDILWAEISKWKRNNPALDNELIWTKEKLYMKGYPEEWFAVARTASTPDALQGFHADDVLYIIDEASGVEDKIFEPVLGALSTEGARLLMCGNPTQLSGFFFDSHHKNRGSYKTFHLDGSKSNRVSKDFVNRIVNMYGKDSDVYRVRVAGDFPLAADDVAIPLPLVEKSVATEYFPHIIPLQIDIGCDVARFGNDKTVITYRTDEKSHIRKRINGQDTMKTADDIMLLGMELVDKYGLKPRRNRDGSIAEEQPNAIPVKIDDGGVGGGVTDRLKRVREDNPEDYWWLDVYPIKFGQKIARHKFYDDTTTLMFYNLKKLLMDHDEDGRKKAIGAILPDDEDLVAEISCRKYKMTEKGKIRIESKEDMKKRGLPSPDTADSILLCYWPVKKKG